MEKHKLYKWKNINCMNGKKKMEKKFQDDSNIYNDRLQKIPNGFRTAKK